MVRVVRWKLKSCPRCGGDLFIDKDLVDGWFEQCLQCSHRSELKDITEFKESPTRREKELVSTGERPSQK